METYIATANVYLDDRLQANNPMSVNELLGVFAQNIPSNPVPTENNTSGNNNVGLGLSGDDTPIEPDEMNPDDPPVDPTPADWDNIIIPALRRFLQEENAKPYEIDVTILQQYCLLCSCLI